MNSGPQHLLLIGLPILRKQFQPGLMRANIMSDVQCEQRGRSMGVSWSATLLSPIESRGVRGGDAETVRLVGRARKLIRNDQEP